ncbi:MAG TPA: hypothetical protein VFU36_11465, partial [Jatrophihabitans sp.]|nr:hypothetical protein [Jatrophihabitans sp.]
GTRLVVTGGGCAGLTPAAVARVFEAATGRTAGEITLDHGHQLWARGLLAAASRDAPAGSGAR